MAGSRKRFLGMAAVVFLASVQAASPETTRTDPLCRLLLDESILLLNEASLDLELAQADVAAFGEIFGLIEGLWEADAIPRMQYLEAKYDLDSARLRLQRAKSVIERQTALVEQYRLICEGAEDSAGKIDDAYRRYRRADCAAQEKSVEVSRVDLEFAEQLLESVRELRAGEVATRPAVIRAELQVERNRRELADARKRAAACRSASATSDAEED